MILKKLEIQGFKSFADRTEVLFTPGVIAVVGPNGSGKSNISDAILWVLGEQNVRNIRGQKSQDVIFAGTDKRKPVGMAEVSLTIDNSSGRLPLDYAEVTVTRRAYRSGESEFFINKTSCRLKDIYELFMDTGVGREAYSIVSQGELDAILSARSEDRRALFDEAAGIKKYRHRKKEAERKLESTDQNLFRVNDIVCELQGQIEPMAEQAEVAARYLELSERLQEIEVGILVNDLQRFNSEIQGIRNYKDQDVEALDNTTALLSELEAKKASLTENLSATDIELDRRQSVHQEALTLLERLESRLALVRQQHQSAMNSESTLTQEIDQLQLKISQLDDQRQELVDIAAQAGEEEKRLDLSVKERSNELRLVQGSIEKMSAAVNSQKTNYIELAKQLAAQKNELINTTSRIESLQVLFSRRSDELRDSRLSVEKSGVDLENAEADVKQIKSDLNTLIQSIATARTDLKNKQADTRKTAEELATTGRLVVERQSRLGTLQEMEDLKEGYFQGVRSVAAAVKSKTLSGKYDVVADVIKVPKGYETAYEVALGSSLQDIITDTDRDAKTAIEFLKQTRGGRATFLPLNMMRHSSSPMLKEMVGKDGILGIGSELISFDARYAPAIDSLLAKTLIAEDIDSAVAASKVAMGWNKIVTLEGEIVSPSGAMTGGHAAGKTLNILGRKQDIDSLITDINALQKKSQAVETSLGKLEKESEELTLSLRSLEDQDTRLKMSLLEKERQLEFAGREAKRLRREMDSLQVEKDDIESNLKKSMDAKARLKETVESADKENINLDGQMSQAEQEIKAQQAQYDAISAEIGTLNVSLASLKQKRLGIEQTIQSAVNSIRDMTSEAARKQNQITNSGKEIHDTESRRIELESDLERAKASTEETRQKADEWRALKQKVSAENLDISEKIKHVSEEKDDLSQRLHASELRETRLDMQISQAIVRLMEEYDITAEDALRRELPAEREGSSAEVIRLRREIKSMGDVNTGAVQEYARITERFEFLSTQRQDLMDARQKLVDAIREIDESTRGIFMETFKAVDEAFRIMFVRLFNGGNTDLILTDPENLQDTGIDVMVEMPGKKKQNLLLLSGGERALTASALMFALMTVRPSPFCVLDEIDAPLDEANVERFADVIREFAEKSQMIVITHNRATMEAADMLYGVTMQEPGISKMVSIQIRDVEKV
ncbi:MAG: chromosome segregation protein SMC [Armatimonadota bacterium]